MYPTLEQLKQHVGAQSADDDTLLIGFLAAAKAVIEGPGPIGCNRQFEVLADSTRRFDADRDTDGPVLMLDHDLCAITSITNGDGAAIALTNYTTVPVNTTPYYAIRLKASSTQYWAWTTDPAAAIVIVGKWGYSTSAPADIGLACLELAKYYYHLKDSAGGGSDSVSTAELGILTVPNGAPASVMRILRGYRGPRT